MTRPLRRLVDGQDLLAMKVYPQVGLKVNQMFQRVGHDRPLRDGSFKNGIDRMEKVIDELWQEGGVIGDVPVADRYKFHRSHIVGATRESSTEMIRL